MATDGPSVVEVPGLAAPELAARLASSGATVVVVRPADLDALQHAEIRWAGLRAGVPPVVPPDHGLPAIDA